MAGMFTLEVLCPTCVTTTIVQKSSSELNVNITRACSRISRFRRDARRRTLSTHTNRFSKKTRLFPIGGPNLRLLLPASMTSLSDLLTLLAPVTTKPFVDSLRIRRTLRSQSSARCLSKARSFHPSSSQLIIQNRGPLPQ